MAVKFYLDNATPQEIEYALLTLSKDEILSKDEFVERFQLKNWSFGKKISDCLNRLSDMGIFQKKEKGYLLTGLGVKMKAVLLMDREIFFELFHYIQYSKSSMLNAREYFWTYKTICSYMQDELKLPPNSVLIGNVIADLEKKYNYMKIAIDASSISKVIGWIKQMGDNCPISDDRVVHYRGYLPYDEILLIAIDYIYKIKNYKYGFPIILDDETRAQMANLCFLKDEHIDKYINRLIDKGKLRVNMGLGGISVILDNELSLVDWIGAYVI